MTALPRNLSTFRLNGVQTDPDPSEVAQDLWTDAQNCVSQDAYMQRIRGWSPLSANNLIDQPPLWHLANTQAESYWLYHTATVAGVGIEDGTSTPPNNGLLVNATQSGNTVTASIGDFSGCTLNGFAILNKRFSGLSWYNYPDITIQDFDTTDPTTADTLTAAVCWSFDRFLFLGDCEIAGNSQPDRIQHAASAEPGTLPINPQDWWPVPENDANFTSLADTRGRVVNGIQLGANNLIVKERGLYQGTYVGAGTFVFRYRNISREVGGLCRHCVTAVDQNGYIFSDNDLVWTDGRQVRSLADTFIRRRVFSELNGEQAGRCWVQYNRPAQEIWFAYPAGGSEYPNKCAVWSLATQKWGLRDLGENQDSKQGWRYARPGIYTDTTTTQSQPWVPNLSAWNSGTWTAPWRSNVLSGDRDDFIAIDVTDEADESNVGQWFVSIGNTDTTAKGNAITGVLSRHELDLGSQDDVKLIRAVYAHGQIPDGLTVRVGGQATHSATIEWSDPQPVDTANQKASLFASGRLISVEFSASVPFQLPGFSLEGTVRGRY
jgi:hypothetical protein